MNNRVQNIFPVGNKVMSQSSQVGSYSEVLQRVKEQIDFACISESDKPQAEEICLIIAEVLKFPPSIEMQIGGVKLPAEMVQEIYSLLRCEHIELVISNFAKADYVIHHKKTYLRTALYNSVFEFESHYANQVNVDFES